MDVLRKKSVGMLFAHFRGFLSLSTPVKPSELQCKAGLTVHQSPKRWILLYELSLATLPDRQWLVDSRICLKVNSINNWNQTLPSTQPSYCFPCWKMRGPLGWDCLVLKITFQQALDTSVFCDLLSQCIISI